MFQYEYKNDVEAISELFNLKINVIARWSKSLPKQAHMLDNAFSAMSDYNDPSSLLDSLRKLDDHKLLNEELGLPKSIDKLNWSTIPTITIRKWFRENRDLYIAMVIGLRHIKLQELWSHIDQEQADKIQAALSSSDTVSLYLADPDKIVRLVKALN